MLAPLVAGILMCAAPQVKFEDAKSDAGKRAAYVAQAVKEAGLDGLIKSWFLQTETKHADKDCRCAGCAEKALKEEYKQDSREFYFAKEIKNVLAPVEVPSLRAVLFCRDGVYAGSETKAGVLVLGDLFALANEDEVKSVLQDYVGTFAKHFEKGLKIEDREVDTAVPAIKNISTNVLFKVLGQQAQLTAILKGTRKVSDGFKQDLLKQYLATYGAFSREIAKQKKIYDDNNENTLQKEIYDSLEFLRQTLVAQVKAGGLEHKAVNAANHEYALEPVKK